MSIKGSFVWGKNVKPDYVWFNGTASHYLLGDTFDPSKPLVVNPLHGSYDDPDSKIDPGQDPPGEADLRHGEPVPDPAEALLRARRATEASGGTSTGSGRPRQG